MSKLTHRQLSRDFGVSLREARHSSQAVDWGLDRGGYRYLEDFLCPVLAWACRRTDRFDVSLVAKKSMQQCTYYYRDAEIELKK